MPLASISNCTPDARLAFGRGLELERELARASSCPSRVSRSPCRTWISIARWWLTAVVNISPALTGMVELRGMMTFIRPPKVSMPSESGVTSSSTTFLHRAGENAGLDRGAEGDGFVGILRRIGLALEKLGHELPDERHPRHAADEDDFVEVCRGEFRIGQSAQAMGARALR